MKIIHPLPYKALVFDVDGTLRGCTVEGQPCPNNQEESYILPHVQETLRFYTENRDMRFGLITNQGGIGAGFLTFNTAQSMLIDLGALLFPKHFCAVFICPHLPEDGCPCRKPSPYYLLHFLYNRRMLTRRDVLYVGDLDSDREMAQRADVPFMPAVEFFER